MRGTNEVFTDYEKYLKRYIQQRSSPTLLWLILLRLDYLTQASLPYESGERLQSLTNMQKKFVDAVNGKSGLNFFEALESEV